MPLSRDEFHPEVAEDSPQRDDGDRDDEPGETDEERRERLAQQAIEDLLEPEAEVEPQLKITRDSSESDRAYALYQRMGGF